LESIKDGQTVTGNRVRVRVTKNKVAPPFRQAEFDIMFSEGISKTGDIVDLGTAQEVITKRGAFYTYKDTRLGQGRENAKRYLKENPAMAQELERVIRAQSVVAAGGAIPTDSEGAEDDDE
jgi:recombination protein RecA